MKLVYMAFLVLFWGWSDRTEFIFWATYELELALMCFEMSFIGLNGDDQIEDQFFGH